MKIILVIFIFLYASLSSAYVSNGGDAVLALLVYKHKNILPPPQYLGNEISLSKLQMLLSEFGISSCIETYTMLNTNFTWLVLELKPLLPNSESEIILIEKSFDNNFYIYDMFKYQKSKITTLTLNKIIAQSTKRVLVIESKKENLTPTKQNIQTLNIKKDENKTQLLDITPYIYTSGEQIKIPMRVNLGSVAYGGVLIPVTIPIINTSTKPVHITNVQVPCGCITNVKFEKTIKPKTESQIKLFINPLKYEESGSINTYLNVETSDNIIKQHRIEIIGLLDDDSSVFVEPYNIFDNAYSKKSIYTIDIFTKSDNFHIQNLKITASPDVFTYNKIDSNLKIGKYTSTNKIILKIKENTAEYAAHSGNITITFLFKDMFRTFIIPFKLSNNLQ